MTVDQPVRRCLMCGGIIPPARPSCVVLCSPECVAERIRSKNAAKQRRKRARAKLQREALDDMLKALPTDQPQTPHIIATNQTGVIAILMTWPPHLCPDSFSLFFFRGKWRLRQNERVVSESRRSRWLTRGTAVTYRLKRVECAAK